MPDAEAVLALGPEELATKILFWLRRRADTAHGMVNQGNIGNEFHHHPGSPYGSKMEEVELAFSEAWSWLEVQGLLVKAPGTNGSSGFRRLSRRARAFESETDLRAYAFARRLPKEALHPRISNTVWSAFMRGEFDVAVFQAMKAVEVSVKAAVPGIDELGVRLMRKAFDPKSGRLTDYSAEEGERDARSALFAGAIGSYKNPHSHRDVHLEDPEEAIEIILLANHLLRIVDSRIRAIPSS